MTDANKVESIGERLHKARLKKKASIEDAYKETRIYPKVLTALEEDRYEEFMSPIYIKAFLKSYCRYLDLDARKILSDYDALVKNNNSPGGAPVKLDIEAQGEVSANLSAVSPNAEFVKKWFLPVFLIIGGIIAGLLCIFLTAKAIGKIRHANLFRPKAVTSAKITKTDKVKPQIIFKKSLSISEDHPLKLTIKAKGKVWLKVKSDGKTVFENVLKKNSIESYDAGEKFQIWAGNGELIDLMLNGNPLGSPGKGTLKNIILTRDGLAVEK